MENITGADAEFSFCFPVCLGAADITTLWPAFSVTYITCRKQKDTRSCYKTRWIYAIIKQHIIQKKSH